MTLLHIVLVGCGGFFGAIARYAMSEHLNKRQRGIPLGTLTVNLLGSFMLGILTAAAVNPLLLLLVGVGFLGAFTTFSTLKLELVKLYAKQDWRTLLYYVAATYGGGLLLAYAGYTIGQFIY